MGLTEAEYHCMGIAATDELIARGMPTPDVKSARTGEVIEYAAHRTRWILANGGNPLALVASTDETLH